MFFNQYHHLFQLRYKSKHCCGSSPSETSSGAGLDLHSGLANYWPMLLYFCALSFLILIFSSSRLNKSCIRIFQWYRYRYHLDFCHRYGYRCYYLILTLIKFILPSFRCITEHLGFHHRYRHRHQLVLLLLLILPIKICNLLNFRYISVHICNSLNSSRIKQWIYHQYRYRYRYHLYSRLRLSCRYRYLPVLTINLFNYGHLITPALCGTLNIYHHWVIHWIILFSHLLYRYRYRYLYFNIYFLTLLFISGT
jgi:hypothetical protein